MVNTPIESIRTNDGNSIPNPAVIADDPQVIRAQIEKTRAQMGHTLDEIQVRLSPDYIKKQTQDSIREATVEKVEQMAQKAEYKVNNWRSSAVQTVKENPIPAAMIGIGIGWLLLSDNDSHDGYEYPERYYRNVSERPPTGYYNRRPDYESTEQGTFSEAQNRVSETAENVREWADEKQDQARQTAGNAAATVQHQAEAVRENVGEATARAQEYVSETAEHARERAEEARMQARYQARRVKRNFWHTMEENPLVIGIAAAAAGALVGLALPATEKENELMGETRDRLVREASATAEETLHKAQTVAEHAAQTAVEDAKREAEKQDLPMPSAAKETTRTPTSTQSTPSASA